VSEVEPRAGARSLLLRRLWRTARRLLELHAREHRALADALAAAIEESDGESVFLDGDDLTWIVGEAKMSDPGSIIPGR
jgi:hypothetical protein